MRLKPANKVWYGAYDRRCEDYTSETKGATKENVVELVGSYLPEFSQIEMGHSLDEKM